MIGKLLRIVLLKRSYLKCSIRFSSKIFTLINFKHERENYPTCSTKQTYLFVTSLSDSENPSISLVSVMIFN